MIFLVVHLVKDFHVKDSRNDSSKSNNRDGDYEVDEASSKAGTGTRSGGTARSGRPAVSR